MYTDIYTSRQKNIYATYILYELVLSGPTDQDHQHSSYYTIIQHIITFDNTLCINLLAADTQIKENYMVNANKDKTTKEEISAHTHDIRVYCVRCIL